MSRPRFAPSPCLTVPASLAVLAVLAGLACSTAPSPQFSAPDPGTQAPWTSTYFDSPPDKLQFAILSDRTGGMRPGVFAEAVDKVQLLRPEFVMSVGDLIDGYSEDPELIDSQWREFEAIVAKLEVPFFHVPGNHDISNEFMASEWKQRLGLSYYHFVYKDALFLCLNTEDPPASHISDAQVTYFRNVLAQHPDPRWTFVFMHKPLWVYDNKGGFEGIEADLEQRPHTLFSAHHHNFLKADRGGNSHYVLATTGGGSALRGVDVGELDHITWVTLGEDSPTVALTELSGLLSDEIVIEDEYDMVDTLRRGSWFQLSPAVGESPELTELEAEVILENPTEHPLQVSGILESAQEIEFEPGELDLTIAANSTESVPLSIIHREGVEIDSLEPIHLTLTGTYDRQEKPPLSLDRERELTLDWVRDLPVLGESPEVDGDLSDWENVEMIRVQRPGFFREGWDWKGTEDGWFQFAAARSGNELYIAIETFDDELLLADSVEDRQDKLMIHVTRTRDADETLVDGALRLTASHNAILPEGAWPEHTPAVCSLKKDGLILEASLPLSSLSESTAGQEGIRLNIGFMDHDNASNTKPSVLWWKPTWDRPESYARSGLFRLDAGVTD